MRVYQDDYRTRSTFFDRDDILALPDIDIDTGGLVVSTHDLALKGFTFKMINVMFKGFNPTATGERPVGGWGKFMDVKHVVTDPNITLIPPTPVGKTRLTIYQDRVSRQRFCINLKFAGCYHNPEYLWHQLAMDGFFATAFRVTTAVHGKLKLKESFGITTVDDVLNNFDLTEILEAHNKRAHAAMAPEKAKAKRRKALETAKRPSNVIDLVALREALQAMYEERQTATLQAALAIAAS